MAGKIKAAESALKLEQQRLQMLKQLEEENQALTLRSNQVCWHTLSFEVFILVIFFFL